MIFSSIFFLFFFLPLVLILYFSVNAKLKNYVLLIASLLFYAWGEIFYVFLMLFSICLNYCFGLWLEKSEKRPGWRKKILGLGIILNLLPLFFFKYGSFFILNLNVILAELGFSLVEMKPLHLPVGISFFTFQAISYIVDVYRKESAVQRKPVNLALYIALFPQLIAGPIVRYHDVAKQLLERSVNIIDFQYGVRRFVAGLAKKVLIANNIGAVSDHIFELPAENMPAGLLWLGMISFTLQIYYDFSGYSDMAIGLGRMFGFHFQENFNYPYAARSMQDFWRRWHISLSSWFRDYLYIPLGGNRRGVLRTYINLLIVFFLCGLWHGAGWNFVFWGVYHGFFLVIERLGLGKILQKGPRVVQHCYTVAVFSLGWVFFRTETMADAMDYLGGLVLNGDISPYLDARLFSVLNAEFYCALAAGLLLSWPVMPFFSDVCSSLQNRGRYLRAVYGVVYYSGMLAWIFFVIVYCSAQLVGDTHNPFLYFRF